MCQKESAGCISTDGATFAGICPTDLESLSCQIEYARADAATFGLRLVRYFLDMAALEMAEVLDRPPSVGTSQMPKEN